MLMQETIDNTLCSYFSGNDTIAPEHNSNFGYGQNIRNMAGFVFHTFSSNIVGCKDKANAKEQ
jgi:hypothetical protein